jgi:iron-sulfur cluster repair protein YtfE (RIC family)
MNPKQPMSFLTLLETHRELDELFLRHQEALLALDLWLAGERLDEFERQLRSHIRLEEERLLPLYRRAGPLAGGAPELFSSEHRKMLALLGTLRERLAGLDADQFDLPREVLQLLEHETMFKHLVEHHDLRERKILYPALDEVTTEQERRDWTG